MVDLSIVFCMFTRSGNPYLAWLWLVISPTNLGPKARRCNHRGSMSSTRCKTLLRGRRSLPKVERGIGEKTWKYGVLSNIHLCIYTIYYIRVCIICTCIYIYTYIYVCVPIYIYIYKYIYVHTFATTSSKPQVSIQMRTHVVCLWKYSHILMLWMPVYTKDGQNDDWILKWMGGG